MDLQKGRVSGSGYICCSTYGRARSKGFHCRYYKQLLAENGLPNIRRHDLRSDNPFGKDYFDELFEQCSYDYDKNSEITKSFYAFVQNKLHFAVTGKKARYRYCKKLFNGTQYLIKKYYRTRKRQKALKKNKSSIPYLYKYIDLW